MGAAKHQVVAFSLRQQRFDRRASPLAKYQDLVVGSRGFARLLLHELVVGLTSWVPGALGLLLRKLCYPWLLGSCGRNVTFGQGVVLRHPAKIRVGEAAGEVAAIAHQVLGAIGFTQEHVLNRYTRRLWAWRDDFGSESVWAVKLGHLVAANGADALWPMLAAR